MRHPVGRRRRARRSSSRSRRSPSANSPAQAAARRAREQPSEWLRRDAGGPVPARPSRRRRLQAPVDSDARVYRKPRLENLPGGLLQEVLADEIVEGTVENCLRIAGFVLGAVVLDELVGVEDVAADLAAEANLLGGPALLGEFLLALLLLKLDEARPEDTERGLLVRALGALVLDLDDDSRRNVRDPDR